MRTDYINFFGSPWYIVPRVYDLDSGYFRILCKQGSNEKSILVRATEWIPTKCKDNGRRYRRSDGRFFARKLPLGKESIIIDKLCKCGYKPEKERII